MNDKYNVLFESVDQISNARSMEDKYKRQIKTLEDRLKDGLDRILKQMVENK
jgi:hypothetical protein